MSEVVDCLVIGSGLAGSIYALQAVRAGLHVTLITGDRKPRSGNSALAQGGIIFDESDGDLLRADLSTASANSANPVAIDTIVQDGPKLVRELLIEDLEVPFDDDENRLLKFTREGAHSLNRIIYSKDQTGLAIINAIHSYLNDISRSKSLPNGGSLTIATEMFAVDLLTLSHSSTDFLDRYYPLTCIGAYILNTKTSQVEEILAKKTVLATGGVGQIYLHSTNSDGSFGHGIAMAYRMGARVIDLEYIQFHPTVYHRPGTRPFLISEALRGEGGVLVDHRGIAFMEHYHHQGSLAPRDIIARSIHSELLKSSHGSVYIDLSGIEKKYLRNRFPTINARLLASGLDMTQEPIPVVPAAHYICGGIHTDMAGNTNIINLSAIGETACTGLHGANRLASTSLLECVVMGNHAARQHIKDINSIGNFHLPSVKPWKMPAKKADEELILQDLSLIRNTMWNYVGLVRTAKRLSRATNLLRELKTEVDIFYGDNEASVRLLTLRNAIQCALLVAYAALKNRDSLGCHYRNDDLD